MDDDFDWRPLARRLTRRWPVIALTALVAVAVAVALTLYTTRPYRSEAVLAVAKPDVSLQFDERFSAPEPNPSFPYRVNTLRAYGDLALTPALAERVLERLGGDADGVANAEVLLQRIEVRAMADGSLIAIGARASRPEPAARIANAWAETFSQQMADVFSEQGADDPVTAARDEARAALDEADEALAVFHASSALPALEVEHSSLRTRQRLLLEASDRLASVERDLVTLRPGSSAGNPPDLADRLATLTLRLNALTSGPAAPVDLDVPSGDLDVDVSDAALTALGETIAQSGAALGLALTALPDELAAVTAALEGERAELERLGRERTLAEERYMTLARKADERSVALATSRPELRLAAAATVPARPDLGPLIGNVLAALALGLVAGAALALLLPVRDEESDGNPEAS